MCMYIWMSIDQRLIRCGVQPQSYHLYTSICRPISVLQEFGTRAMRTNLAVPFELASYEVQQLQHGIALIDRLWHDITQVPYSSHMA
jgi:hypothetical protein